MGRLAGRLACCRRRPLSICTPPPSIGLQWKPCYLCMGQSAGFLRLHMLSPCPSRSIKPETTFIFMRMFPGWVHYLILICCKSSYFPWIGSVNCCWSSLAVILSSESSRTHDHVLLYHDSGIRATRSHIPWVVWLLFYQVHRLCNIEWMMKWIQETGFSLPSRFHKKRDTQWVLCYYRHNKFREELMLFTFL
jgi:hypothetical protein